MYRVEYSRLAARTLKRLPADTAALIRSKIDALASDPNAPNNNVKSLAGRPGF